MIDCFGPEVDFTYIPNCESIPEHMVTHCGAPQLKFPVSQQPAHPPGLPGWPTVSNLFFASDHVLQSAPASASVAAPRGNTPPTCTRAALDILERSADFAQDNLSASSLKILASCCNLVMGWFYVVQDEFSRLEVTLVVRAASIHAHQEKWRALVEV